MARVNKIFITLLIVLSLFPFAEYLLFIFQNPSSGITLKSTAYIGEINFNSNYAIIMLPDSVNCFQDYVIFNYAYGNIVNNTIVPKGLNFTIFKFLCVIIKADSTLIYSPLLVDIFVFSSLLVRSLYIACSLFLIYLTTLPVILPLSIFKRRSKT